MGVDITVVREETRGDGDYIRRKHAGGERVYGFTPGSTGRVVIEGFDLSHLDWQDRGNCLDTDPEAFFPGPGDGVPVIVRAVCDACEVRQTCLDYALERPQLMGVWGGTGERERARMRRRVGIIRKPQRHAQA